MQPYHYHHKQRTFAGQGELSAETADTLNYIIFTLPLVLDVPSSRCLLQSQNPLQLPVALETFLCIFCRTILNVIVTGIIVICLNTAKFNYWQLVRLGSRGLHQN